jgi:hypothetical protein
MESCGEKIEDNRAKKTNKSKGVKLAWHSSTRRLTTIYIDNRLRLSSIDHLSRVVAKAEVGIQISGNRLSITVRIGTDKSKVSPHYY